MKRKFDINAKKAFMDYKLEISKEIGALNGSKDKTKKSYSENEYNHLGRS